MSRIVELNGPIIYYQLAGAVSTCYDVARFSQQRVSNTTGSRLRVTRDGFIHEHIIVSPRVD